MAVNQDIRCFTAPANASLDTSAAQHCFVDINSSAKVAVVASAGGRSVGVLQNRPAAANRACQVAYAGIVKVVSGGSITAGADVKSDASGHALTAIDAYQVSGNATGIKGSYNLGVAMAAADTGDLVPVLLTLSGALPGTAA